ncbi:VLRF1 family aeRF1-type release factor [Litchfieldia alkalitelluris]|uniref:VLRF1 family aeRF1-type release factor n=1 Tax=Litchfieldia alkalitelluris TaxID=304268 RepID=UPI0009967084|nr:VLRF1 family aeRF1-type release factor [Litchfieldia alkalitelluris]
MTFQKKLKQLQYEQRVKPDKILTMYLNTDRSDQDQQGGEWEIALKNGFNRLEQYLEASSTEELRNLQQIREKVEPYVLSMKRNLPRSIILFATADESLWEVFELQVPVDTYFFWEEQPMLDQLVALHENYPSTALVLMQQNQAKIIETSFGTLHNTETYEFDLDDENWRIHAGPQPSSISNGASATQQDHVDNRVKVHQQRWWKSFGSMLDQIAAKQNWERIMLVGDREGTDFLEESMNKKVHKKIQKNLLNENEHKVLKELVG